MKSLFKYSLATVLCLVFVLSLFSIVPFTASAETSGDYEYALCEDGTVEITRYNGTSTELIIPSELDGKKVTSIGADAFISCKNLTNVTIPDGVTSICSGAFNYCTSLTSITIPNSVTNIDRYVVDNTAFYNDDSNWENGVLYIGHHLIKAKDSLSSSYSIKNGTITIADYAFEECDSLTIVTIPDGVTSIGDGAFKGCTSISSITIPDSVTGLGFNVFDNTAFYNDDSNWENGVLYIGHHLISAQESLSGSYSIKSGTLTVVGGAFFNCENLTSVTIPNSITSIPESAFIRCASLTSITIPDSVTSIGGSAFSDCKNLTSITIPEGVTIIGAGTFSNCTNLTSVTIPNNVKCIDDGTFERCTSLSSVTIPNSVTSINYEAFSGCSNLTNVTIPDSVTYIGSSAFEYCTNLTSITIPNSVTDIGSSVFNGCTSLASITIPDSVTDLGFNVFDNTAFYNDDSNWENGVLYIGNHLIKAKRDLSDSYSIKDGTLVILPGAFMKCNNLTSVIFPNSVKYIGSSAFEYCTDLIRITIPDNISRIEWYAFHDCQNLKDVYYLGTKDDWNRIEIEEYNQCLTEATIHYGELPPTEPVVAKSLPTETKPNIPVVKAKKANPITVSVNNKNIKAKKLKKSKVAVKNAVKVTDAKGKVTYKKLSGSKKLTISKKGVITVKKGKYKKGKILKIKVKVTAAGNTEYKKGSKTVTVKVKIK